MSASRVARAMGVLTRDVPMRTKKPIKTTNPPDLDQMCSKCRVAHRRARDVIHTALIEVTDPSVINYGNIDIEVRRQYAGIGDFIPVFYPGRTGWLNELRVFSHEHNDYIINLGVTVIYRKEPHNDECRNTYIETQTAIRSMTPSHFKVIGYSLQRRIVQLMKQFSGEGVTAIDERNSPSML